MTTTPRTEEDGRRARSRRTRARIVDAARARFVELGYWDATIDSIAESAEVAVQTVYYVFGTKRNLLAAVLEATIVGDAEPVAVAERGWVEAIGAAPDGRAAVELLVNGSVAIVARVAAMYDVVRNAAAEPEIRELLDETRRRRRADQRLLVDQLERSGHLRAGVAAGDAADVVYGLLNEEVFLLLAGDCGWSAERYARWVADTVLTQLADPSS